ncbi:hypothetical protein B0O80DRAFT_463040 [Mortierella sp. GBAus27b]|nr:hypothetical protein B0O80DRAFT_463040 [Mortierella sp. GBAus27b]
MERLPRRPLRPTTVGSNPLVARVPSFGFFVLFLTFLHFLIRGHAVQWDMIHGWQTKKAVVPSTIASWLWGIVPTCLFSMGAGN